jgi:transcription elongation factor Elf1
MSEVIGYTAECPGCGLQARIIPAAQWLRAHATRPCTQCGQFTIAEFIPVTKERDLFERMFHTLAKSGLPPKAWWDSVKHNETPDGEIRLTVEGKPDE